MDVDDTRAIEGWRYDEEVVPTMGCKQEVTRGNNR
jgi:hypothetical protein